MTPAAVDRLVRTSCERGDVEEIPAVNPFEAFVDPELDVLFRALRDYAALTDDPTARKLVTWASSERFVRVAS